MLNRRHILALGAAAGAAGFPGLARAQARAMTFCSWGGALSEFEKTTMLDPFAKTKGIEIVHASPTNYAKLKAMVESGPRNGTSSMSAAALSSKGPTSSSRST